MYKEGCIEYSGSGVELWILN